MLKIENISAGYGKKQVLFDVSLEVKQSEIVLLVGSNGSGKSTLLKTIYGIIPSWNSTSSFMGVWVDRDPDKTRNNGVINFEGREISNKSTTVLLKLGLLYIPQKNNLFEELTVRENLEMAGLIIGSKLLQKRIDDTLSIFTTLVPFLHRTPMKLSGGERQLLTLAMATLHQPKMILMDEPFTGLSPQNIDFVADNLNQLKKKSGVTLLIVEHRVKECSRIADRVIGLKLGRVFSEFAVNATFNINQLQPVFV